jgi:NAD+ kinase
MKDLEMKIGIFGKALSEEMLPHLLFLHRELRAAGVSSTTYKPFYELLYEQLYNRGTIVPDSETFSKPGEIRGKIDYLLSIGGDGTLLDTIGLVSDSDIPILGINLGRLGFLSAVSKDEIHEAVACLKTKNFLIENHSLLSVCNGLTDIYKYALNELSIQKDHPTSLLTINVYVNGDFLNSYYGDGILVATPTGSTAYSLSCGGPIISPDANAFVITPIATHNLTVRPIIIPDSSRITLKVEGRDNRYIFGLDSHIVHSHSGNEIHVCKADFSLKLVRMPHKDFFTTLREKLHWGIDKRN